MRLVCVKPLSPEQRVRRRVYDTHIEKTIYIDNCGVSSASSIVNNDNREHYKHYP